MHHCFSFVSFSLIRGNVNKVKKEKSYIIHIKKKHNLMANKEELVGIDTTKLLSILNNEEELIVKPFNSGKI